MRVLDDKGAIVREPVTPGRGRRPAATAGELKPGQQRKELEGVFLVTDGKAQFQPVETGIVGDKYFEVLSGLEEGNEVVVGPFSSVRELRDGVNVKVTPAPGRNAEG